MKSPPWPLSSNGIAVKCGSPRNIVAIPGRKPASVGEVPVRSAYPLKSSTSEHNFSYQTHKSECVQPHQISGCNENWPRLIGAALKRLSWRKRAAIARATVHVTVSFRGIMLPPAEVKC